MEKTIESKYIDPVTEIETIMITIDRGNGEYTSMLKSTYEAQQVEHLTEIPTQEAQSL